MSEQQDWLTVLRQQCEKSSQARVAKRLQLSTATISQVLNGTYGGGLDRIQARVEGVFMGVCVECPVLGEIPRDQCVREQGKPFAATNPVRVALYRACRDSCQHSFIREE